MCIARQRRGRSGIYRQRVDLSISESLRPASWIAARLERCLNPEERKIMNRITRSCYSLAFALTLVFALAPAALAHAHPKIMKPAPDSVGPAPSSVSITFSEAVEPKFSSIQLTDEKGNALSTETSRPAPNDPTTLLLAVPKLTPGIYIVHWANVAVDGHRLDGSYKFTVQ